MHRVNAQENYHGNGCNNNKNKFNNKYCTMCYRNCRRKDKLKARFSRQKIRWNMDEMDEKKRITLMQMTE